MCTTLIISVAVWTADCTCIRSHAYAVHINGDGSLRFRNVCLGQVMKVTNFDRGQIGLNSSPHGSVGNSGEEFEPVDAFSAVVFTRQWFGLCLDIRDSAF